MASFHPADDRNTDKKNGVKKWDGIRKSRVRSSSINNSNGTNSNNNNDETDDIAESDSDTFDYDHPYHETALDWYQRHVRRRSRRLIGFSSSSSSSSDSGSDSGSISSSEDHDHFFDASDNGGKYDGNAAKRKRTKDLDKAVRSAERPLKRWLASYPLVAARSCLSSMSIVIPMDKSTAASVNYRARVRNNSVPPLPPRVEEMKRLRRILRRLRRKRTELREKFRCRAAVISEQTNSVNHERSAETPDSDQCAIHSFLPHGTGISFIDAVLNRESLLQSKLSMSGSESDRLQQQKSSSRLVLELSGPPRSGMTAILLAVAARYVASTSHLFFPNMGFSSADMDTTPGLPGSRHHRSTRHNHPTPCATEPRVVILDVEKGMHTVKLILSVREAVLRRWEETASARQWRRKYDEAWKLDDTEAGQHGTWGDNDDIEGDRGDNFNSTMIEQRQIELAISSCLGRINIVQPRDFTHLGLVATIEALRHGLDKEKMAKQSTTVSGATKHSSSQQFHIRGGNTKPPSHDTNATTQSQEAPTLIMIDSLTTLDASTRFLENLHATAGSSRGASSSGLSDRNEFYRQLVRIGEDHDVAIIGTSRCVQNVHGRVSSGGSPLWERMVSHRISLHHVVEGSQEDKAGYDCVATLNVNDKCGDGCSSIFPYSVVSGGIAC